MKPISAPVVKPLDGPRSRPTVTTELTVNTLKTSPDGNRNAPMVPARMNEFERR